MPVSARGAAAPRAASLDAACRGLLPTICRMSRTTTRHHLSDAERYRAVTAARERFLAGDDRVRGIRPEVATSWYRCREQYHVDPRLCRAPVASVQEESSGEKSLEHEIV